MLLLLSFLHDSLYPVPVGNGVGVPVSVGAAVVHSGEHLVGGCHSLPVPVVRQVLGRDLPSRILVQSVFGRVVGSLEPVDVLDIRVVELIGTVCPGVSCVASVGAGNPIAVKVPSVGRLHGPYRIQQVIAGSDSFGRCFFLSASVPLSNAWKSNPVYGSARPFRLCPAGLL